MGAFDARPRALVIVAFAGSAVLFAGAAAALVAAQGDDDVRTGLPQANPTLVPGGSTPSAAPQTPSGPEPSSTESPDGGTASPTAGPTAGPTTGPSAVPSATSRATSSSSPRPRSTSGGGTRTNPDGLFVDATIDPADGATYAKETVFKLFAHATDGDGDIRLVSVSWGDGTKSTTGSTTACPARGTGDCKDFALNHVYSTTGTKEVYLTVSSGPVKETAVLHLTAHVNNAAPTASPSDSPSPSPTASTSS